jgi:hypothetical protein
MQVAPRLYHPFFRIALPHVRAPAGVHHTLGSEHDRRLPESDHPSLAQIT